MPEERGYQSRVAPGGPAPVVQRSAASFGANVGAAIADAAETANQTKLRSYRLDRQENADSEAADFAAKFAKLRTDMDVATREARGNAAAGAKGHAAAVQKRLEEQREALLGGITEDNVRRGAIAQLDDYSGRVAKSEGDFEEGRRVDKLVTDVGQTAATSQNRTRTSKGDASVYAEELTLYRAAVEALPGVGEDVRDALIREGEQKISVGYLQGMMDERPAEAKAAIMAGEYSDIFTGEQLDALINGADVEIRRVEAAAEREEAQKKAELDERFREATTRAANGEYIADDVWAPLEAAYGILGEGDKVAAVQGHRSEAGFARAYEQATPVQIEQRVAVLQEKGKPTAAEQRELQWLEQKGGALTAKFQNDPFGSAQISTKSVAPPLDLADPASVQARLAWTRAASKATGRQIPLLSKGELAGMQEQYQGGEGGQAQLLAQLDAVPSTNGTRSAVARQIAPNDRQFQVLAEIDPSDRRTAREGKQVLATRKDFLKPSKDNRNAEEIAETVTAINEELAFALRAFPGEAGVVQSVARQIAAGALAQQAKDGDDLNEATWRGAMNRALGGGGKPVLGEWNGKPYIIADKFTPGGFEAAVMRDRARKDKNPPVNPDGSPLELKRATPVFIGAPNGIFRYHWEIGRAQVKAKDGSPYVTEVSAGRR